MMLGKQQLLDAMLRECEILKHLYGQLPADRLDYRPTPGQRSTLELLRYLSMMPAAVARGLVEGSWDHYYEAEERSAGMSSEEFPMKIDQQMRGLREIFDRIDDETFASRPTPLPWDGETRPLAEAMLDMPLKYLVGYRMQLFLYAKASGASGLTSGNCWRGRPLREDT